jgi:hypothetical protein
MTPTPAAQGASALVVTVLMAAFAAVWIVPFWRICRRLNHQPALALLMWLPLLNVILLYYVAFAGKRERDAAPPTL